MTAAAFEATRTVSAQRRGKEGYAKNLLAELRQMSKASLEHDGLLNHAQAALILDVSTRRIGELVELGKLTRLDFLGRTYVSVKEIVRRRDADLKVGRPRRSVAQRIRTAAKIMSQYDAVHATVDVLTPEPKKERRKRK